ncbi:ABC transporter substrate-binding protein [Paenibacillus radicibacter]|uniref:ABC transporter substrate-binding protein n=1 Tax=Paenibacillus radicibacter TaxID=2972488 RepID=UPI00215992C7|nr:extracellular solute-binding protein [Paenibacillus radicibacter]
MKKPLLFGISFILLATVFGCSNGGGETAAGGTNNSSSGKAKPKSPDGKTIVTISAFREPLEAVEQLFEKKYPDIDLQIQPNEETMEKHVKTMNTAILSGKGADIINTLHLPIDKYIEKKLLLNMSEMLDQDPTVKKNDLQMNILDGLKINGGLYGIARSFYLGGFYGDGDALSKTVKVDDKTWTWKQLEEVSRQFIQSSNKQGSRYAVANLQPQQFLSELIGDSASEFIDLVARKAKFDSPEFVDTIKRIKKMYDDRIMTASEAKRGDQLFSMSAYSLSPFDFFHKAYLYFPNPRLMQSPHPQGHKDGGTFRASSLLSIQANSPVKDEAWKFIAFLMSEEAQSLVQQSEEGYSILKSVNEKMVDSFKNEIQASGFKTQNGNVKVTEQSFDELKQLIQTANRHVKKEDKMTSIIEEEAKSYFSGQKTAEEAAKLIQNRVTTYLNE